MQKMLSLIGILLCSVCGCIAQDVEYKNITCQEAYDLIQKFKDDTNFVIIDFRPERTYNKKHIENSIFFDVFSDEVNDWLDKLDRNKTYLIYCMVGYRSGIAFKKMKEMNFTKVYHLHEGIRVWEKEGYKIVSETH